jgi:hypothetical protein
MPNLRGIHRSIAQVDAILGKKTGVSAEAAAERALGNPDCAVHPAECYFLLGRFQAAVEYAQSRHDPEDLYWLTRGSKELAIQSFAELAKFPTRASFANSKARCCS